MISMARLVWISVFAILIFLVAILWYKHAEDQMRIKMIESAVPLQSISEESEGSMAQQKKELEERFKNNHYNIQNYGKDTPLVDVKALCDQPNGINCVYFKDGSQFYYGEHD